MEITERELLSGCVLRNSNYAAVVVEVVVLLWANWNNARIFKGFLQFVALLCDVIQEAASNLSWRGWKEEKERWKGSWRCKSLWQGATAKAETGKRERLQSPAKNVKQRQQRKQLCPTSSMTFFSTSNRRCKAQTLTVRYFFPAAFIFSGRVNGSCAQYNQICLVHVCQKPLCFRSKAHRVHQEA